MPLTIVWVVPGDLYHNAKAAFKSSRESNGFRPASKWNSPSFIWVTKDLTLIAEYERATVDGEERTIKATITLKGRNEAHASRLKEEWDQLFGVEGKEPQADTKVPEEIRLALWAFEGCSKGAIERWSKPNSMSNILPPAIANRFRELTKCEERERWKILMQELKEKYPGFKELPEPSWLL